MLSTRRFDQIKVVVEEENGAVLVYTIVVGLILMMVSIFLFVANKMHDREPAHSGLLKVHEKRLETNFSISLYIPIKFTSNILKMIV